VTKKTFDLLLFSQHLVLSFEIGETDPTHQKNALMKTILFLLFLLHASILFSQEIVKIYEVKYGHEAPVGEWYVIKDKKEYKNVFYMDFKDKEELEIQLDSLLEDLDINYEDHELIDVGDGYPYFYWVGVGYDEEGNKVDAFLRYQYSIDDPTYHLIALQYGE
jgi:hypothetical protein